MKRLACCAMVLFGGFIFANGQSGTPAPQNTPNPMDTVREKIRQNQAAERRAEVVRNGGDRNVDRDLQQLFFQSIQPLYRKPTREELKLLAPNEADLKKYAEFLKRDDAGIIKLIVDLGCSENPNIVVATPDCIKYSMPGAGSSFSFRFENYRLRRLADLTLTRGSFVATGVMSHGIMVNLGDISLEQVLLTSNGVKFLIDFVPADDFAKAAVIEQQLITGIQNAEFRYSSILKVQENATYVLRSIAYRGTYMRAVQRVAYNELFFDKRKDVLIAFRVIRRDADGSITILWKELQSKRSPKLRRERPNRDEVRRNNVVAEIN